MTIIAISGKRRSGKSTLAEILWKTRGYHPISLAGPLKALVMSQFNMSPAQVDGELKEVVDARYNKTPRQIMIDVGQFYRSFNKNWWIDKLIAEMMLLDRPAYVIPDVRFVNELKALHELGAYSVRLERSEDLTGTNIDDISETELDNYPAWDYIVPAEQNVVLADLHKVAANVI